MPLTDVKIKNAKAKIKPDGTATSKLYRMADEKGLYLEVAPSGGKLWRLKYRYEGKQKLLALGAYPEVSLKQARMKRNIFRQSLSDGIDPSHLRKADKQSVMDKDSFETVAREWHIKFRNTWSDSHADKTILRLEQKVFPWLGSKNINDITAPEVLTVLRRIESKGHLETAHRVKSICGRVFKYAISTGRAERDPSADLQGALPPTKEKHHASITDPVAIGALMRAIQDFTGTSIVASALKLSPLVFVRPGELRKAEWSEIDLSKAEWRISAEKMKSRVVHIVPLSRQSVEILEQIKPLTGRDKYVFPSSRTITRPMSENTVNAALRRMGYTQEEMTAHGFRSMASTNLNEQGFNYDWIERQLAHVERNGVRGAYNYAQYLPDRKKMMQTWADYLDGQANGGNVVPINKAGE